MEVLLHVIIVVTCCKPLHVATSLNEACSYLHCIIHISIKVEQEWKNLSKIYKILMGMDPPVSKIKVTYVNRKSVCRRKIFPFTACVRQEIVKIVAEKWALCTGARLWLEMWQCVWQQLQHSFMLGWAWTFFPQICILKGLFVGKMRCFRTNTLSLNHHSF